MSKDKNKIVSSEKIVDITHEKTRPYTQVELDRFNKAIDYSMTKVTKKGKLVIQPITCPLCLKEILIQHVTKDTKRNEQGFPIFDIKTVRTSSLDYCMRCKAGKKQT